MAGFFDFFRMAWGWLSRRGVSPTPVTPTHRGTWTTTTRAGTWAVPARTSTWTHPDA